MVLGFLMSPWLQESILLHGHVFIKIFIHQSLRAIARTGYKGHAVPTDSPPQQWVAKARHELRRFVALCWELGTSGANLRNGAPFGRTIDGGDALPQAKGILQSGLMHFRDVATGAAAKPGFVDGEGAGFVHHWSVPVRAIPKLGRRGTVNAALSCEPRKNLFYFRFHRQSCASILLQTHLQARSR